MESMFSAASRHESPLFSLVVPLLLTELQGHAIKNQDLLVASGAMSLGGSEGLSAVDDDIEAAVGALFTPFGVY
jgi:hypothetical protein